MKTVLKEVPAAAPEIILASASAIRAALLANAGVKIRCQPADIDERAVQTELSAAGTLPPAEMALALAKAKARAVAAAHPGAIVIGADQILALGLEIFSKPNNAGEARLQLMRLRGRAHTLVSAFVCLQGDRVIAEQIASAELAMRDFSDSFLDAYLEQAGNGVLSSVGAYQLEGLGAQLFERIDGDYFTVLGLPLLPLLAVLRRAGAIRQ